MPHRFDYLLVLLCFTHTVQCFELKPCRQPWSVSELSWKYSNYWPLYYDHLTSHSCPMPASKKGACYICAREPTTEISSRKSYTGCHGLWSDFYDEDCRIKNQCSEKGACGDGGKCGKGYSTRRCKCPDSYYGYGCQSKVPKDKNIGFASGVDILYQNFARIGETLRFAVSMYEMGTNPRITINTKLGNVRKELYKPIYDKHHGGLKNKDFKLKTQQLCAEVSYATLQECNTFLKDSVAVFHTELQFRIITDYKYIWDFIPYLSKMSTEVFPLGYADEIEVKVFNSVDREKYKNEIEVFSKSFTVFVEFPRFMECFVELHLSCENKAGEDWYIDSRTKEYFSVSRSRVNSGPLGHYIYHTHFMPYYKCYNDVSTEEYPRLKFIAELPDGSETVLESKDDWDTQMILFERDRDWKLGMYSYCRIELDYYRSLNIDKPRYISIWDIPRTRYIWRSFAQCRFRVLEIALVAIISGGTTRFVDEAGKIVLDGSRSYNPNKASKSRSKSGFTYRWSCSHNTSRVPCLVEELYKLNKSVITLKPFTLKNSNSYIITLQVSIDESESSTNQILVVGQQNKTNINVPNLEIVCMSCVDGVFANPKEYLYILTKATYKDPMVVPQELKFSWEYTPDIETRVFKSVDDIRIKGTSDELLKVDKVLKEGTSYLFRVSLINSKAYAEILIKTSSVDSSNCSLVPTEGIAGVTLFSISCEKSSHGSIQYMYEFYDKFEEEELYFSGRMLGSSFRSLKNFRLTRGRLAICSYGAVGVLEQSIAVKLKEFNETESYLHSLVNESKYLMQQDMYESSLSLATTVADVSRPEQSIDSFELKQLLSSLYEVKLDALHVFKLCLLSLKNILGAVPKQKTGFEMEAELTKQLAEIISSIADRLYKWVKSFDSERSLSDTITQQMIKAVIDIVANVLKYTKRDYFKKPPELISPDILENIHGTSERLTNALRMIVNTTLYIQIKGENVTTFDSADKSVTSWALVDLPQAVYSVTQASDYPNLRMDKDVVEKMSKFTDELGVQFTVVNLNPFWWEGSVTTKVFLLIMCHKTGLKTCQNMRKVLVQLFFPIQYQVEEVAAVEGQAQSLPLTWPEYDLDMNLTVYRFHLPPRAKLFVKFEIVNSSEVSSVFKVLFLKNIRPDYKLMKIKGKNITSSSSVYEVYYKQHSKDLVLYMGIYPEGGGKESVGTKKQFKVKIYYTQCNSWLNWKWEHESCWTGEETNASLLCCYCKHLSWFGGIVKVPDYKQDPFSDLQLFLTEKNNWVLLLLAVIILTLFMLSCFWGLLKDKRDLFQKNAIILEDNYPGERFAYLIGVYTGARFRASTSAHIGVKLQGDQDTSRPHVLQSRGKRVFQNGSEDWFLLYSPYFLGFLESLQLWHDNTGESPDWFVQKIIVFDLTDRIKYIFNLNVWLSMEVDETPEVFASPITMQELFSVKSVFQSNVETGFRDTHYWTSILWKHPRDPVSRPRRLCAVTCFTMVAMSVSMLLLWYTFSTSNDLNVDYPSYSINNVDLLISLITFGAASSAACCTMALFRRSSTLKRSYRRKTRSLFIRTADDRPGEFSNYDLRSMGSFSSMGSKVSLSPSATSQVTWGGEVYRTTFASADQAQLQNKYVKVDPRLKRHRDRTTGEKFVLALHSLVRGSKLEPVSLAKYESTLVVHKIPLVLALILSGFLIIGSLLAVGWLGLKIQPIKSEKWITIFLFVIIFDALLFSTFKVLFFSLILSLLFQRITDSTEYKIKPKDGMQRHLKGNVDHLYRLLDVRSQPMYCPLRDSLKKKYRLERLVKRDWKTLMDFVVLLCCIAIVGLLSAFTLQVIYNANNHIEYTFTHGHKPEYPNFLNISTTEDVYDFIQYNFIPQAYNYLWYNLEDYLAEIKYDTRKGWAGDFTTRLLGNVRLRQVRVLEEAACAETKYLVNISRRCFPSWSSGTQDTDDYLTGWQIGQYRETGGSHAWGFTPPEESNSSSLYGATGTLYPAGGFIEDLNYNRLLTRHLISILKVNRWVDHCTRALFVELSMYNVNTRLYSQLELVTEQTASAMYLVNTQVRSIDTHVAFSFWDSCYIVFLIFFLIRMCVLMNRQGIFEYFSNIKNAFELFLVAMGFLSVALHLWYILSAINSVVAYQRRGLDEYLNLNRIFLIQTLSKTVICILLACLVVRLFISWKFGRVYFTFLYTFILSLSWIVWLLPVFVLTLALMWRFIGYSLGIFLYTHNTSFIIYRKDFSLNAKSHLLGPQILLFLMCFLSQLIILTFIISFSYYYKVAKVYKFASDDQFSYLKFLRYHTGKLFNRRKHSS